MKILVTPTSLQPETDSEAMRMLKAFSSDLVFNPTGKPLSADDLISLLSKCDGYLAGLDDVSAKVIASCHKLKVISRYGAGYDRVDIAAAKAANIPVTNTPGANAQAVGELAMGLILSLARRIPYLNNQTKTGAWVRSMGVELKGKTLGILGLGAIGKVVARCGQGFGLNIITYDPYVDYEYCRIHNIAVGTFEQVLSQANILSLHLPLNDDTGNCINKETIELMPNGTFVINTSRGGLINEQDAFNALQDGRLGGLALDAFAIEPPGESPLFALDNVVVTPHTGAHTKEAVAQMGIVAVQNLIAVLNGEECAYVVNRA